MEGQGVPPLATEGNATDSSAEQGLEAGRLPRRRDAGSPGNGGPGGAPPRRGPRGRRKRRASTTGVPGCLDRRSTQEEDDVSRRLPKSEPSRPKTGTGQGPRVKPGAGARAGKTIVRLDGGGQCREIQGRNVEIASSQLRSEHLPVGTAFPLRPGKMNGEPRGEPDSGEERARKESREAGNRSICEPGAAAGADRGERAHEPTDREELRRKAGFQPTRALGGFARVLRPIRPRPKGSAGQHANLPDPGNRAAERARERWIPTEARGRSKGWKRGEGGNPGRRTARRSSDRGAWGRGCKLSIPSAKPPRTRRPGVPRGMLGGRGWGAGGRLGKPIRRERGMTAGGQGPR
jgi:hypothetical protein